MGGETISIHLISLIVFAGEQIQSGDLISFFLKKKKSELREAARE